MSVAASDLIAYAAASMPSDDASTSGGAIDLLRFIDFTQIGANDTIEGVSSSAADTSQTLTIEGRDSQGRYVTETKTLTGTTAIGFSVLGTVERVTKAELSATCAGIITVRRATGPVTIRTLAVGTRGFMMIFRKTASDPSVQKDYYCKFFWKNTHGTLALLSALVQQSADPDARITHALDASVGASTSVANRVTSPGFTFDDTDKAVPGTDLAAGIAIGTWLHLLLPAADAAHRTSYTSQLSGSSV